MRKLISFHTEMISGNSFGEMCFSKLNFPQFFFFFMLKMAQFPSQVQISQPNANISWEGASQFPHFSHHDVLLERELQVNEKKIKKFKKNKSQTTEDMLSESSRCNAMVADLHFPRFFGTPIQCEIARRFPRSVVKAGLKDQCKNISILSAVQPRTSMDLKSSHFKT